MRCLRLTLLILASGAMGACAVAESATQKISFLSEDTKPRVYYVGVPELKLYPQPQSSKEHIAELPLNERLLRYKVERGFAYVKVARTGQAGWVINRCLVWKKTATQETAPAKALIEETDQRKGLAEPEVPPKNDVIKAGSVSPEIERHNASCFDAF
jgi:hypothetical protein